jgi:translation initiation factor 1A
LLVPQEWVYFTNTKMENGERRPEDLPGNGVVTGKNEVKNETGEIIRVRLPQNRKREMFSSAELLMGANRTRVRCYGGITRMGRIRGRIQKKVWIRDRNSLFIIPWDFQDGNCDIIHRYTGPQVEWLGRTRYP